MSPSISDDGCGIDAFGVVEVPWREIPSLRKPAVHCEKHTLYAALRNADEQTVLAVSAVLRAIEDFGWKDRDFSDWAVIAAPRYLGRVRVANNWEKFQRTGVRGVSPYAIPSLSLHAVSGTVSMVLRSHGPNFGVGGVGQHLSEAFQTVRAMVNYRSLPGIWLVMTEWSPEAVPDAHGEIANQPIGVGVALAINPNVAAAGLQLTHCPLQITPAPSEPTLQELADFLRSDRQGETWCCPLDAGRMELTRKAAQQLPWTGRRAG
jgi:hypothetical protein